MFAKCFWEAHRRQLAETDEQLWCYFLYSVCFFLLCVCVCVRVQYIWFFCFPFQACMNCALWSWNPWFQYCFPFIKCLISLIIKPSPSNEVVPQFSPGVRFSKHLKTFRARKAVFEIQSLSIRGEVLSPKTSANFLVDLTFYWLAFETNESLISVGK